MNNRLYAVRDTETGKLVSDLKRPKRKFWQRKNAALNAMAKPRYLYYTPERAQAVMDMLRLVEKFDVENEVSE